MRTAGRRNGGTWLARASLLACVGAGIASGPGALRAQQAPRPRNCFVEIDTAGRAYQQTAGSVAMFFAGGAFRAHCRGENTTLKSDSSEWYSDRGELRLIGNVHFRDTTAILDADRVTYWTRQERLYAEGHVYTRNLQSGSEMRGPNLDYYRAVPAIRDTLEILASGRPTIRFRPAGDSVRPDTTNAFFIVADRVKLRHTDRFWGSGHVTIDRPDMHAKADSAQLNLADSLGYLIGAPEVIGLDTTRPASDTAAAYRLVGQRIRFTLDSKQHIKTVRSSGDADATGPDWRLTADTIDAALDSGKINRAQAWGRNAKPVAVSGLSRITADSLDIQMPAGFMRLVWAWGRARANSKPDSTKLEDDWLSGDTLRANFATLDSAGRRRTEIERVTAFGTARAYYHTDNEKDPNGERGINYSRGERIQIAMRERKVRTVDIVGQVDGIFLEPLPPGSDTLQADSTRTNAPRRGTRPRSGTPR